MAGAAPVRAQQGVWKAGVAVTDDGLVDGGDLCQLLQGLFDAEVLMLGMPSGRIECAERSEPPALG